MISAGRCDVKTEARDSNAKEKVGKAKREKQNEKQKGDKGGRLTCGPDRERR
jgi:hypothetical protein